MKKSRLEAVLWDMDGTLVDTEPYWHDAELELVGEFGGTWTEDDQASVTGFDLRDSAALLRDRGGVDLEIDEIVNRMLDVVIAKVRQQIPWRPGARELLGELHERGIPCALVTMSWRSLVDAIVRELPSGSFKITITGDEVVFGKPHPEPYLTAAAALNVDPQRCVAIEDSPTGLRSAVAAGCVVVAVPNSVAISPHGAYRMLDSLEGVRTDDLVGFVRKPAARSTQTSSGSSRTSNRRRTVTVLVASAVIIAGLAIAVFRPTAKAPTSTIAPAIAPATIAFDTWVPAFLLPDSTTSLQTYGGALREAMPFWYTLVDPGTIILDPAVTAEVSAQVVAEARQHKLRVMPSILDKTSTGTLATLLADPVRRQQHADAIVALVTAGGFDGIDIDYEQFGYNDPHSSWESTSVAFTAFIGELSTRLHAQGKTLSVTVPPIYDAGRTDDSGYWVYDYATLAPLVDRLRILAYDYSVATPGPIAPLSFVRRAIAGATAAVKDTSKVDLAVPLYGYNWVVSTDGTCSADAPTGKTNVSQRSIDDLLAKRAATPVFDAQTGESSFTYQVQYTDGTNTCTQTRQVNFVDAEGTRLRIDLARTSFLGGVALWAIGYDSPATWTTVGSLAAVQG